MSPGQKPSLKRPPSRADLEARLGDIEKASSLAQQVAVADAEAAGVSVGGEGEGVTLPDATVMMPQFLDRRRKGHNVEVTAKLTLSAELNGRLERLVDQIPRSSKNGLIMHAIHQFVDRMERKIAESKKKQAA